MSKQLTVDPDELVLTLFFKSSANRDDDTEGRENILAITPSIYTAAGSSSPCIPATFAMAWLAYAPFATPSQRIDGARRKYGEAVVKLQNAIQDPRTAKTDDILFTVLLIRILEIHSLFTLLFRCPNSYALLSSEMQFPTATSDVLPASFKHLHGAMTLVNLRGLQNFSSDVAIQLLGYFKVALVRSTRLVCWLNNLSRRRQPFPGGAR